jgi:hypothetical protein
MKKQCGYVLAASGYTTDCGSHLINRPSVRCDKCGGKPYERKKDVTSFDRPSDGTARQVY